MNGAIEHWDSKGFGIIRGEDKRTYLAHYTDFEKYKRRNAHISMEIGDDVSFTPDESGGKFAARDIEYDDRSELFKFAYFADYEVALEDLAVRHATPEKWSSSSFDEALVISEITKLADEKRWFEDELERQRNKFGSSDETRARQRAERRVHNTVTRRKYDVLFSYFERTFERVAFEKRIVYSEQGAATNTGLGNKFNRDIYAVFRKSNPDRHSASPYMFDRFADENFVGKHFPAVPELPDYFNDPVRGKRVPSDHLIFDCNLKMFPDHTHLFDERRSRFPPSWQDMSDEDCANGFQQLLDRTRDRVKRNFRAAVPFYYPALKRIQMLLPITFNPGTSEQQTRALVVSREGAGYSAETIMPLEWAYKNARLLAKPDREDWLDF